jgi:hypothetical protein
LVAAIARIIDKSLETNSLGILRTTAEQHAMPSENPESSKPKTTYVCPWCERESEISRWYGVATHQNLPYDPVLGEPNRLRFSPSRFGPEGRPIDPEGTPCDFLACPACRNPVPLAGINLPMRHGITTESLRTRLSDRLDEDLAHPQFLCLPTNHHETEVSLMTLAIFVADDHLVLLDSSDSDDLAIFDSFEGGAIREIDVGTRGKPSDTGASS